MICKPIYNSAEIEIQDMPVIVEVFMHSVYIEGMTQRNNLLGKLRESKKCMCFRIPGSSYLIVDD